MGDKSAFKECTEKPHKLNYNDRVKYQINQKIYMESHHSTKRKKLLLFFSLIN